MKNKIITITTALFFATVSLSQTTAVEKQSPLPVAVFAAKIQEQVSPQIIDARSADEFALNHLSGAVNFNLQSADYEAHVRLLNKNKPVFIYSIANGRSGQLARDLKSRQFTEVYELKAGIAAWVGSGIPYYTAVKRNMTLPEYKNILASGQLVLVDIGSRYCGACKKVKPLLDSLRRQMGTDLKIVEIELEESPQLIAELKTVDAFPYLILYKQGEVILKRSGLGDLKETIDEAIAKAR